MRYVLGIEYDGTDYCGWQRLRQSPSVQEAVEKALSYVAGHPVEVTCAGRTDSGVHGLCQVVHFDTEAVRSDYGWMMGVNTHLPKSIAVRWIQEVDSAFHARFSALARHYRYRICNRVMRPALDSRYVAWIRYPLDADLMHEAAQPLLGENDFSAFRSAQCEAKHPRRFLHFLNVQRVGEEVQIEVQANAFLHHMVRNFVGSLLPIGRGEKPVSWMKELLDGRDRSVAGATGPAQGLLFLGPLYSPEWGLPDEVTLKP